MIDRVVTEPAVDDVVDTRIETAPAHGSVNGAEEAAAGTAANPEKKTRRPRRRTTPAANGSEPHGTSPSTQGSNGAAEATAVQNTAPPLDQHPEQTDAMSERYLAFLHNFQRDRTLPPSRVIEPSYDITTLSIDELSSSEEVYNRELSWLSFNWRVLHEAVDPRTPLLERLKFIAITSSNLDEYFSKRVGGLKRQKAAGVANLTLDGWAPDVQLSLIAATVPRDDQRRKRLPA